MSDNQSMHEENELGEDGNAPLNRIRRWRLVLGESDEEGESEEKGEAEKQSFTQSLSPDDLKMDQTLEMLYGTTSHRYDDYEDLERGGGMRESAPVLARWLGDIRRYFPTSAVTMMQRDAIERHGLYQMLLEPELLEAIEPDVHMVANLLELKEIMPDETRATAQGVVARVAKDLLKRLQNPMNEAISGSINLALRNFRPRMSEVDWHQTIRVNLKHYQPDYQTIIPERLIGYGRHRNQLRDVILCVDQSGSMAMSTIYSGICAAVMATIPSLKTQMVLFDTSVVDVTDQLDDPIDLLFGINLGGGTDINRALLYVQQLITRPSETILILITDLYEGGRSEDMLAQCQAIQNSGTQLITLLALSDGGKPTYHHENASSLAGMGVPCFGCTPDKFPELMAAAINKQDIHHWAAKQGFVTVQSND